MHRYRHAFVFAALIAPGSLAVAAGSPPPTTTLLTSVEVLTDRLLSAPGSVVELTTSAGSVVAVTSVEGQTPWLAVDASAGLRLVLGERAHATGISVGMLEQVPAFPAADGAAEVRLLTISRTQPLAVPVFVEGKSGSVNSFHATDGSWPHWGIHVPGDSALRVTAHVTALLDNEAVRHFTAYRGHAPAQAASYVRGVDLVLPGVELGSNGIVVSIALLGDLGAGATLDAFNYAASAPTITAAPEFTASVVLVQNDQAYVHISGKLRRGHLALLLRPAGGPAGLNAAIQDAPPTFVVPAGGGQGIETAGSSPKDGRTAPAHARETHGASTVPAIPSVAADCDPPVPDQGNWTCTPLAPAANSCGGATSVGTPECQVVRSRTAKFCRSSGSVVRAQQGRTAKWKVSFQFGGGSGTPLTSGGGFEYGEESTESVTDQWTAAPGAHGLGQCMRFFRFELVCAQKFLRVFDSVLFIAAMQVVIDPCAKAVVVTRVCRDTNTSQSVCDRTP